MYQPFNLNIQPTDYWDEDVELHTTDRNADWDSNSEDLYRRDSMYMDAWDWGCFINNNIFNNIFIRT